MKYVLMFVETEKFAKELADMTEGERQASYEQVAEWFARHSDKITHHGHLQPAHTATTMLLDGGEAVLTDGPFVEGKEVVSGYAEVEVADLDEALAIARTWPACPLIEIRPLT
ncbi:MULTISPECIES: YciI family protein [Actinomadura]|uniref:YciI family protein n=1 Tax=Actinomadura TaxID=1988 RepID=UPI0003AD02BE|nr:YciI family protein [Actinomadura madurae]MCP9953392.1 YciI family protein [Actinomadura madurae]MCP9970154.1 YciI family protein [Actinomadura madurae]MCP9982618.1 YciI family protein [Actinomadura madurae]MCQ0005837.1 YciI family protein [Actinomadura madurae]MCQ0018860.1 YciI family protein [Actinomadura madurae]